MSGSTRWRPKQRLQWHKKRGPEVSYTACALQDRHFLEMMHAFTLLQTRLATEGICDEIALLQQAVA